MQFLYSVFVIFLFMFFFSVPLTKNRNLYFENYIAKKYFLILFVSLFFGLRNVSLGGDSGTYLKWYLSGSSDVIDKHSEIAFELIMKIFHFILFGQKPFLFTMSFIISFLTFECYEKIDKRKAFFCFVISACFYYFYIFHLSMYRQGIAIPIIGLSFCYYKQKNYLKYIICGVFAFFIHYTGIVFLVIPVLCFVTERINSKKFLFFLIIIFFIFFRTSIVKSIIEKIPVFCYPIIVLKSYYLNMNLGAIHVTHSHIISIFIIIMLFLNYNSIKKTSLFYLHMYHFIYFVGLALLKDCVIVYDRLYFYIQIFEPIIIINFSSIFKERKMGLYLISFFILLYSFFTIYLWGPRNLIQPYYW